MCQGVSGMVAGVGGKGLCRRAPAECWRPGDGAQPERSIIFSSLEQPLDG